MRKIVALLLALMMSCMLIPVMAEDSITGEWYASFMGVAITLTVNEDGSFQMALPGQDPTVGTWTLEGDQFTMTADDTPVVGTVTEEGITASDGGMELFFTREPIAEITVSEVKAAETVEEFYGDWAVTYMEADGIILDPAAAGMPFPQMKIGEGVFEFVAASEEDFMASLLNLMGFEATFENGMLNLNPTMEGADTTGTIEMLEDGMVKLTLSGTSPMILYFSPVVPAEEQPAA